MPRKPWTDEQLTDLLLAVSSGESKTSLGKRHGVSRERIRQLVNRARGSTSLDGHARMDPVRAMLVVRRDPKITSFAAWGRACGQSVGPLRNLALQFGIYEQVRRLFRMRRRYWRRKKLIEAIQEKARELGRVPRALIEFRSHFSLVQREFGSWNAGLRAAGLPTTERGKYPRKRKHE
jgi:hypothetical protein